MCGGRRRDPEQGSRRSSARVRQRVVNGRPFAIMGFTVRDGRIVAIDAIADPERVGRLAASVLGEIGSGPSAAEIAT
jgi:hypothetical protein